MYQSWDSMPMYDTRRRVQLHCQEYFSWMGKYFLDDILGHGGANQLPRITKKFTKPNETIIIRPLTAVLTVASGGGGGCSGWVHGRGVRSGDRDRGQVHGRGDTNDLPIQIISHLKQLTSKILALDGSEVKDPPTPELEKSKPWKYCRICIQVMGVKEVEERLTHLAPMLMYEDYTLYILHVCA